MIKLENLFERRFSQIAHRLTQIKKPICVYLCVICENLRLKGRSLTGFTFMELLITLILLGICFLPLMNMFSVSLQQNNQTSDITTARYLAQEGMEKMKNLHLTVSQLKQLGDVWDPPLKEAALIVDGKSWRVLRKLTVSEPLQINIQVFREEDRLKDYARPVVELVTLVEDLEW